MRSSDAGFFVAAAAIHLAFAFGARHPPPHPLELGAGSHDPATELAIDVEIERAGSVGPATGDPRAPTESEPLAPSEERPRASAGVAGTVPSGPVDAEGTGEPHPPAPPGTPTDEYGPPEKTARAPGADGRPVYVLPGVLPPAPPPAPAPTRSPAAAPVDRDTAGALLRDAMRGNDKAIGIDLPSAGTVASVIRDGVRAANTPGVSRATFEVRLGPDGRVLGVRVVRSNAGSSEEWARAARLVASSLAGKGLPMGAFTAGAIVLVDVLSDLELPAGKSGEFKGAGASFDLSNIGAHAARVVRTSFRVIPLK